MNHEPRHSVAAPPVTVGRGNAVWFAFRGRLWEVLPVHFDDGVRLTSVRHAVEAMRNENTLTAEKVRDYHAALRSVVALAPKYLKPAGLGRRLAWHLRLRKNPYRDATEAEVGWLLGCLLAARGLSRIGPAPNPRAIP